MRIPLLLSFFLLFIPSIGEGQVALGEWQDHLPYNDVRLVADVGDKVFAATEVSLFSFDKSSREVERFNRVKGLNDVRITALEYNSDLEILVIGYANGNLDMMKGGQVVNLSDIKRSDIVGDKGIYDVHFVNQIAWLSTGFGIVLVDIEKDEVADTYFIAPEAATLRVNAIEFYQGKVVAATNAGIRSADQLSNLADFNQWTWETPEMEDLAYDHLLSFDDELLVARGEEGRLMRHSGNWIEFPGFASTEVRSLSTDGTNLCITARYALRFLNTELTQVDQQFSFDDGVSMNSAIQTPEGIYIGDEKLGLIVAESDENFESIAPNGPFSADSWKLTAQAGSVWVAHGGLQTNWNNQFVNDQSSGLIDGRWVALKGSEGLQTVRDHVDITVSPTDPNLLYINSWNKGLVRFDVSTMSGEVLNRVEGNAPIDPTANFLAVIRTGGADFDDDGNLWVTNPYTEAPIKVMKTNGEWEEFSCPGELTTSSLLGQIVCGQGGINWVVMPRSNGLFAYSANGTIENQSDDDCQLFGTGVGDGGLPTTSVFAIAEDLDGEIWIGTSQGPAVNYSPTSIFSENAIDFQQILVEQDGNVEILLGNEIITDIEIDGANRKWFATQGAGAFLISEDGGEQILKFDTENSPLLSNEIKDIAIEPTTGEVFFATDNGVVSYRGDATDSQFTNECISVFPNPVREDFTGPITLDGFIGESEIRITDVAGNLVFQTQANGGRAVWNGTDFNGSRVQTGVYFAHAVSRDGESACTSKILLVN